MGGRRAELGRKRDRHVEDEKACLVAIAGCRWKAKGKARRVEMTSEIGFTSQAGWQQRIENARGEGERQGRTAERRNDDHTVVKTVAPGAGSLIGSVISLQYLIYLRP